MDTVFSLVGLIYYMHVQSILSLSSPRAAGIVGWRITTFLSEHYFGLLRRLWLSHILQYGTLYLSQLFEHLNLHQIMNFRDTSQMNTNIINMHIMHYFWVFSYILNSFKKLCHNFFHVEGEVCGIVYHYPIYGYRLLIGRSKLLYACAKHSFTLFSASRWRRRAGGLQPTRTRTWLTINKLWSS